ncbi:hypothetical protein Pmar_PMAR029604 [Perkinsus marinus ATCC 50983]|uniref:CCHC-type domain-containing protein n=1 Tax=Perkinsus marinus (strain ATCC 50983 / TXsc) TaxID=423536 RepID=C5KWY0_PERM5|nr:hypothetical protein Pmar_PMAR029604 [Perkinsus marinus ATCC 50983]EER10984.1 hypothetical protein Pmar_PMAR029604 [Perkinsus marinus ATCC 50983]|eukprot:XP_002779189.1 hypothetical protein Pmar_PMAR029604 [Perkinsus marinus ATCC 50983]
MGSKKRRRLEEVVSSYAGCAVFYYYYLRRCIEPDVFENMMLPNPQGTRSSYAMLVDLFWTRLMSVIDSDGETSNILAGWNSLSISSDESFVDFLARFEGSQRALAAVGNPMTPELAKQALLSKITPHLQQFAKTHQLDPYSRLVCRITLEDRERRQQQQSQKPRQASRGHSTDVNIVEEDGDYDVQQVGTTKPTCRRCGKANHHAKDCRQKEPEHVSRRCKRCGR